MTNTTVIKFILSIHWIEWFRNGQYNFHNMSDHKVEELIDIIMINMFNIGEVI